MEDTLYKVKTGGFEGPLELLLHLIEKRKLFINEISLASITEEYIDFIRGMENKTLSHYAGFVTVAATLILLKSRSLLPGIDLSPEEEKEVGSLEARLQLYQVIQDVGEAIRRDYGKEIIFPKLEKKSEIRVFSPDPSITKDLMRVLATDAIAAVPEPERQKLHEVELVKVKSLREMIDDISARIEKSISQTNFKDLWKGKGFSSKKEERVTVIVSFLAVLELVRQGIMEAFQDDVGDISLVRQEKNHGNQ